MKSIVHKNEKQPRKKSLVANLIQVAVKVPSSDAGLIRKTAKSLRQEALKSGKFREDLENLISEPKPDGFKSLLIRAPLEGISLTRASDTPRQIPL
jgi:hypothetical protein